MGKLFHGRFHDGADRRFVGDAPLSTSVSSAVHGPAHRQLICSYSGRNFAVEREGDLSNVYLISAVPLPLSMTGDGSRMTAQKMQERSLRLRATGR